MNSVVAIHTNFTIAVVKPDMYGSRDIILRALRPHFFVLSAKDVRFTREQVEAFYPEHVDKDYFAELTHFLCSGRSMMLKLCHADGDTISEWRELIGHTNPEIARQDTPHSIRAQFGQDLLRNAVSGSESWEEAICQGSVFGVIS